MKKDKLHVLQVVGAMNRGGAEVMLMDIFRHTSEEIHFDFLVNYKIKQGIPKGDFDREIISKGSYIKYIGAQWDIGPIKYIKKFKKICKEIGTPDVVHIHLNAKGGIIALAAKMAGVKRIIVHSHGDLVFKGSFLKVLPGILELKLQKLLIYLFATDFWGCSIAAVRSLYYKIIINNGKTIIIKNAIDVNSYMDITKESSNALRKTYKIKNNTIIIGAVGRIVRRKNIGFIIDVLNRLNQKDIDFIFINVGKVDDLVYMNEVESKINKFKLKSKIIHLGLRDDIPLVMSTFDVFISPAHNEAFGMVAAEAQAAGIPCLLSTEFPEEIDMNLNLVSFINNFDANKWADEVLEAVGKRNNDRKLIKESFSNLGFDIETNIKTMEDLYRNEKQ